MHKLMLSLFELLKNLAQFLKVAVIFSILCLLLYWLENMASFDWEWLGFITPLLDFFINIAERISNDSAYVLNTNFEYKYCIAIILLALFYFFGNILEKVFDFTKDMYLSGRRFVRKVEENTFNKTLEIQNNFEQKRIKKYQIYVQTFFKEHRGITFEETSIEEENKNLNKFLISKTGVSPVKYKEGFLYTFNDFDHIDEILEYFFKVINSQAPLDYIICVQVLPKNLTDEFDKMDRLIKINIKNKITTLADTVWRYDFNQNQKYNLTQLGLYQKDNDTFEVYEFNKN